VVEKTFEQFGVPGNPASFFANLLADLVNRIGGEVSQPAILEIGPQLLNRVEFGSIRGQPVHVPARMGGQVATDLVVLVRSAPIPQQDERAPMMSLKVFKEPEDVRASDIFLGV
jgi:hypothetical protein